jgi:hypothetical protein
MQTTQTRPTTAISSVIIVVDGDIENGVPATFATLRPRAVRELALALLEAYGTVTPESRWLTEETLKIEKPYGDYATFCEVATQNQWQLFGLELRKFPAKLKAEQEAAEQAAFMAELMADTTPLVIEILLLDHHADDQTSAAPLTPRPTRFNRELWRNETFCCHHWWPGNACHYGNHAL